MVAIAAAENEEVGRSSAHCQVYFKILPHTTKVVLLKKKKQRHVMELELDLLATASLPYKLRDHSSTTYQSLSNTSRFQVPRLCIS